MKRDTIAKLGLCEAMEELFGRDLYSYMEQATQEYDEFDEWQNTLYDEKGINQKGIKEAKNMILSAYHNFVDGRGRI